MEQNYLKDHQARKAKVIDFLSQAAALYLERTGEEKRGQALKDLAEEVEKGSFSIIIVGQFSSGKSTLLNALMGEKYLPSFQTETTATINFLSSVKDSPEGKPLVRVNYRDHHSTISEDVSLEGIQQFVAINDNLDVKEKVESVEVFLDSKFLTDGVSLVDSPGLNGMAPGHREITMEQIDRSHAAIFLFNARQPGSLTDFEELDHLKHRCPSLFIVLNQIDLINLSEQSVKDVVDTLYDSYQKVFPDETLPTIYPVSAYKALVGRSHQDLEYLGRKGFTDEEKQGLVDTSGMVPFEERLFQYLTHGEKTLLELSSPVRKTILFLDDSLSMITSQIADLKGEVSQDKLDEEISSLNAEIEEIKKRGNSEKTELSNKISTFFESIREDLVLALNNMSTRFLESVSDLDGDDLFQAANDYFIKHENLYQGLLDTKMNHVEEEFKKFILKRFGEYYDEVSKVRSRHFYKVGTEQLTYKSLPDSVLDVGDNLQEMENKLEEYENQLLACIDEHDEMQLRRQVEERKLKRIQELEQERNTISKEFKIEREQLGARPVPSQMMVYDTVKRNGIGGLLTRMWKGQEARTKQISRMVLDTSAMDNYDENVKRIDSYYREEIRHREDELRQLREDTADFGQTILEAERSQRKQDRIEKQIEGLKARRDQELKRERLKQRRRIIAKINENFDEIRLEKSKEFDTKKQELEDELVSQAIDLLQVSVLKKANDEILRLENRKKALNEGEDIKKSRMEEYQDLLRTMTDLKDKGTALLQEIDSITPDHIAEQMN